MKFILKNCFNPLRSKAPLFPSPLEGEGRHERSECGVRGNRAVLKQFLSSSFLIIAAFSSHAADWFNDAWPVRRTLIVKDATRGGKVRPVAIADGPTLGLSRPDGGD